MGGSGKSEGAISLAGDRPFCPNFSKTWFGARSQLLFTAELPEACELAPALPKHFSLRLSL
jgi:hypothetical protein